MRSSVERRNVFGTDPVLAPIDARLPRGAQLDSRSSRRTGAFHREDQVPHRVEESGREWPFQLEGEGASRVAAAFVCVDGQAVSVGLEHSVQIDRSPHASGAIGGGVVD
jgi:hypothetical protein